MVECQVTARPEYAAPCGKHKLQVGGVAQRGRCDTDASGWCSAPTSDPASPVQLDRGASRRVDPHRFVTIRREEQVPVICADDSVLDAGPRELPDGTGEVVDDRIHYLSSLEREPGLASVVDLLGAGDNPLGTIKFFGELRGLQAQELVKCHVDQLGHLGSGELLAARDVGKKRRFDPYTKFSVLFDNRVAGSGTGL